MDGKEFQEYIKRRRMPNKIHVARLFKDDPHCYYCGAETFLYEEFRKRELKRGESYPANMATLEHLYDKYDPENRYKVYEDDKDKVLSCYKCNYTRSNYRTNSLSKEYLNKRRELSQKRKKGEIRPILFKKLTALR